jgi:hypothetical protein
MTQTYSNENLVKLDLWGGTHEYNKLDNTYYLNRHAGLFSNLCVCSYGILTYVNMGLTPENISLTLTEYDDTLNFYTELFKLNNEKFDLSDISDEVLQRTLRYQEPSHLGLGREKHHINFDIISRVIKKYFSLSDNTKKVYDSILEKYNIDFENTIFIWARKTDKVVENQVPSVDTYLKIIYDNNLENKKIILQTDDITVFNEFKSKISINILDELPFSDDLNGFHVKLNLVSDTTFYTKYNMSKVEYLQRFLSLVIIASKCQHVILYPGNLSMVVPMIRGNFDNVYSFFDNENLIK